MRFASLKKKPNLKTSNMASISILAIVFYSSQFCLATATKRENIPPIRIWNLAALRRFSSSQVMYAATRWLALPNNQITFRRAFAHPFHSTRYDKVFLIPSVTCQQALYDIASEPRNKFGKVNFHYLTVVSYFDEYLRAVTSIKFEEAYGAPLGKDKKLAVGLFSLTWWVGFMTYNLNHGKYASEITPKAKLEAKCFLGAIKTALGQELDYEYKHLGSPKLKVHYYVSMRHLDHLAKRFLGRIAATEGHGKKSKE